MRQEKRATLKHHQTGKPALRAAAVQFESLPGDKNANFLKIEAFVGQAAAQGVRLIIFPECCITGCWFIRNLGPGLGQSPRRSGGD